MAEQLKIGVIGTSWWAENVLMAMFANYERAKLMAVCGRNRERDDELAAKYNIPQVFTDYHQMIEQGGLDAVVVATPDDTHYEMVMAALDAGLHILCEKPVALNAKDAKAMYEKAEAA
ncbi:MAG: Gfo/Idh/MocA family oxidoreductase, partial [Chloroflexota bacterium]